MIRKLWHIHSDLFKETDALFSHPHEHPAHIPAETAFFLSRRIFKITAATIPAKTRAVKIVPMFSINILILSPVYFCGLSAGRNSRNKNPAVNKNAVTVPTPNLPENSIPH